MIPKSGNRFSDEIMRNQSPRHYYRRGPRLASNHATVIPGRRHKRALTRYGGEPGIHNHKQGLWIPGPSLRAVPE